MSTWRDLAALGSPTLGLALAHLLWQTGVLALGYAAWKALSGASVSLRYRAALLALGLSLVVGAATFWSLDSARRPDAVPTAASQPTTTIGAIARVARAALAVPVPIPSAMRDAVGSVNILGGLAVTWTAGALSLILRLMGGVLLAQQIRRRAVPIRRDDLRDAQHRLVIQLGLSRPVPLLQSDEVDVPVALGWLWPAVLLPSHLVTETVSSLEPLLAHELVHVREHDYAVNTVQTGVDALLFFCPGARWLSAEVRRLREFRCDDAAVVLSDSPARYVRALARLAERQSPAFPVPAATGPRLVDRIRRLSKGEIMPRSRVTHSLAFAASAVATALLGSSLLEASRPQAAGHPPPTAFSPWICSAEQSLPLGQVALFAGNELVPDRGPGRFFHCSPLLIDGRPMAGKAFSVETRGTLTLVHGDPNSAAATRIGFRVSLRRGGKIVDEPRAALLDHDLFEADLGQLLSFARTGDQLIVAPLDARDWRAQRIISVGGC